MAKVANIWRHPIKSHGREALEHVALHAGESMPWDRHWAIAHDAALDRSGWVPCSQFMRGSRAPGVAGLWAQLDETTRTVHLRHARIGSFSVRPDDAGQAGALFEWLAPLHAGASTAADRIVSAGARGMTDSPYASVSLLNMASHAAVSARLGGALEAERWRGNFWLEGLTPWEEFEWIGRDIRIGTAVLEVKERIERCPHTKANPKTGERDADTLGVLNTVFGHQDFGVYAIVKESGEVACGDTAEVL